MNSNNQFFKSPTDVSQVKTNIVIRYFVRWARFMLSKVRDKGKRLAYLDLFCGPGTYEDNTKSTPLRILEIAASNKELKTMLVTYFNDKNKKHTTRLAESISNIPDINLFKYYPIIENNTVGQDLVKRFKNIKLVPSFIFIDPFGYKGLSLDLIGSLIKDWGCDCLIFFNYNRINTHLSNPILKHLPESLFGEERTVALRKKVKGLKPKEREKLIVSTFYEALKEKNGLYSVSYKFYSKQGKTSHFLVFVCKNPLGYKFMKQIMSEESQVVISEVGNFEFNPRLLNQMAIESFIDPIKDLEYELLEKFSGKRLTRKQIFETHNYHTPFVEKNYRTALLNLESKGLVQTTPDASKRRITKGKLTLSEKVLITFN